MEHLLQLSDVCPVCKSPDSENAVMEQVFDSAGGREYLSPLARSERVDLDELMNAMHTYECNNCNAVYLQPWLSPQARSRVFITGHPIHNRGWRNFQEWLERGAEPSIPGGSQWLIGELQKRLGRFNSYAEFGCPFQGLVLGLMPRLSAENYLHSSPGDTAIHPQDSKRFLPPLAWYQVLNHGLVRLAKFFTRIRGWRDRVRGRSAWSRRNSNLPSELCFVPLMSTRFWGMNCNMYGASCTAVASRFPGVSVFSHAELRSLPIHHFDAAGLFNILDHQDDPLNLLRDALRVAKVVICVTHDEPFSRQHHFGLRRSFFAKLSSTIPGCEVEEFVITEEADSVYFLRMPDTFLTKP